MLNEQINRRATVFISENRMMNNSDLGNLSPLMQKMGLMPSLNKQMNFQITPNGLQPEEGLAVELRTSDDSFKISFAPGRIDILRSKVLLEDNLEPLDDFITKAKEVIRLLRTAYPTWAINRLALSLTVCHDLDEAHLVSSYKKFMLHDEDNIVEWRFRKVKRQSLEEVSNLLVNQVVTISRIISQIPFEQKPSDRILIETDFNTVVGQDVEFKEELIGKVWNKMSADTTQTTDDLNRILTE